MGKWGEPCTLLQASHGAGFYMWGPLGTPSALNCKPGGLRGPTRGPQGHFPTAFSGRTGCGGKAVGNRHRNPEGENAVHRGVGCGSDRQEYSASHSEPIWNDRSVYIPTANIIIGRAECKQTDSVGRALTWSSRFDCREEAFCLTS